MSAFIAIDENDLVSHLKNGVCEILHEYADGKRVLAKVTLQKDYFSKPLTKQLAEGHVAFLDRKDGTQFKVLHVWDISYKDWSAFRLDKVLSVQLTQG